MVWETGYLILPAIRLETFPWLSESLSVRWAMWLSFQRNIWKRYVWLPGLIYTFSLCTFPSCLMCSFNKEDCRLRQRQLPKMEGAWVSELLWKAAHWLETYPYLREILSEKWHNWVLVSSCQVLVTVPDQE